MATEATISECREAIEDGFQSSYKQMACAGGRIVTDVSSQTIGASTTATLEILTVRFDNSPPMISGNNILLQDQRKCYNVSVSVTGTTPTHVDGVMTLSLYWFDGTFHNLLMAQDMYYDANRSSFACSLSTCVKSIDRNDNYVYAQLSNGVDVTTTITRYRISAFRVC